ncbi:MAG: 3'(2'),5'-bisphosphate nucleotidase CysQ [Deltaproteobacteria bacterium]|nr:3'(2'),5'-bisphosphate nucleotidase CysQ [Deltaproteobacteria bacterium]
MTALNAELSFSLDLVRECATIAMHYWRGGAKVLALREKPLGGGPITKADTEINDKIVKALHDRFPDDGVLAEESADDGRWRRPSRCWYVDPIDGTREFARGRTGWTIQVGLCIDGDPVLGVVFEPAAGHLSWGLRTETQTVARHQRPDNQEQDLTLREPDPESLVLIGGRLYPLSRQHAIRRALGISSDRASSVGSVGVRLATVARGEADVYVQAPGHTKMWDTCAPAALVLAAGGLVTDLQGKPLDYRAASVTHPSGVVASPRPLHAEILRRVAPLAARWL